MSILRVTDRAAQLMPDLFQLNRKKNVVVSETSRAIWRIVKRTKRYKHRTLLAYSIVQILGECTADEAHCYAVQAKFVPQFVKRGPSIFGSHFAALTHEGVLARGESRRSTVVWVEGIGQHAAREGKNVVRTWRTTEDFPTKYVKPPPPPKVSEGDLLSLLYVLRVLLTLQRFFGIKLGRKVEEVDKERKGLIAVERYLTWALDVGRLKLGLSLPNKKK